MVINIHHKGRLALLCTLMISVSSVSTYAATQIQNIKLNNVTVFIRGAELFNSSNVSLPAGESEVIFTNIANGVNEQSIVLNASNGVVVQSFSIKKEPEAENESSEVKQLTKQIEAEVREQSKLKVQHEVIETQLSVLESNKTLGSEKQGASVEQISQMLELVNQRMSAALLADIDIKEKIKISQKKIAKLNLQLNQLKQNTGQTVNQLVVTFYAPKAVTSDIKLSYVTRDAGWVPTYDVRVSNITQPVKLSYKASVFQNSGINWDKIHLTLSSGNPSDGLQVPKMNPWYINVYTNYGKSKNFDARLNVSKKSQPLPPQTPLPPSSVTSESVMEGDIKGASRDISLSDYVVTDVGGVNTRFNIALPYNIASDGKGHSVIIKEEDVQGDYRYIVVPKLQTDAFLQVQLKDWEKLNLLPGKSNVFFEGSFVGQGYIDINNAKDTLDLSLGRDKKILVNRENNKNLTSQSSFFGNTTSQQYSYSINVKNTRKEPVKLLVLEQFPVSANSAITVEDLKYDSASWNKDTGEVQWSLNLEPNQSKKLDLSYVIKYPKDKRLSGLQ